MSDFSQDIQNFQRYGTYTYKFDSVGNMIFDSSSINFNQVYVAFPLTNVIYNSSKIQTMYNTDFEEFIPTTITTSSVQTANDIQAQLDAVSEENTALKSQLDSVISQIDSGTTNTSDPLSIKQVIFELRKALGEGRVESDFSDTFPYTPIRKDAP